MTNELENKLKEKINRRIETQFKYYDRNKNKPTEQYIKDYFKNYVFDAYIKQQGKPKYDHKTIKEIIEICFKYEFVNILISVNAEIEHAHQIADLENRATD